MKLLRGLLQWVFKDQLNELSLEIQKAREVRTDCDFIYRSFLLEESRIKNILKNIDVSVDVHQYSNSWAVISLQGEGTDYIKFVDLGRADIRHIQEFLRQFEKTGNIKVDASPTASEFLRIRKNRFGLK